MKKIYFSLVAFISSLLYSPLFAGDPKTAAELKNAIIPESASNVLSSDAKTVEGISFLDQILKFVRDSIFDLLMLIAIGVFIFIGARLVVARGNPEEFKKALQSFIYAIVGIFVVAVAWVLVRFIAGLDI